MTDKLIVLICKAIILAIVAALLFPPVFHYASRWWNHWLPL